MIHHTGQSIRSILFFRAMRLLLARGTACTRPTEVVLPTYGLLSTRTLLFDVAATALPPRGEVRPGTEVTLSRQETLPVSHLLR